MHPRTWVILSDKRGDNGQVETIVEALGKECIVALSRAGPAHEAALLKGLGLNSVLITDGNTPLNLLSTAQGLVKTSD
mgnify:CR=1 FL=1